VKLLIGGTVTVSVVLALSYFSLAHFFAVHARATDGLAKTGGVAGKGSDTERVAVAAKKRGAGA
jgi:hypothetical protein